MRLRGKADPDGPVNLVSGSMQNICSAEIHALNAPSIWQEAKRFRNHGLDVLTPMSSEETRS
jgi:hypothetical protein